MYTDQSTFYNIPATKPWPETAPDLVLYLNLFGAPYTTALYCAHPPSPPPPPPSADVFIYISCESTTAGLFLHSRIVCCVCVLGKSFLCIISDLLPHEGFIILPDSSLSFYFPLASISYADLLVRRTLYPFHFFVFFPHSRSYTYMYVHTAVRSSVVDPWNFGTDPDPRILT